jgi:quinone-modifying oxidoreductase subunit QmoC
MAAVVTGKAPAERSDLGWKREILGLDARDLTACYQCGTCSVVCPISTADNPFPRKEMIWVQWGLKERALGDASIWLCHQCATCSAYCPRDARPANVMAALRDYSIRHYAAPAVLGRALADPRWLPALLALPLAVFLLILGGLGHLARLPDGPVVFSKFMPILYIEVVFMTAMALSALGAVGGGVRYWRAMRRQAGGSGSGPGRALIPTLVAIARHRKFAQCAERAPGSRETHKSHAHRSHLLVFWGFAGLVVTTTSVGIGIYAFGYLTPWPLWHPVKILGNVSGAVVLAAVGVFAWRRFADAELAGKSTYSDWLFLAVLGLTTLTGFACLGLRLAGTRAAYAVYVVHLVLIFFLLVYIPYSKFAHLVYRTVAMLHAATFEPEARVRP